MEWVYICANVSFSKDFKSRKYVCLSYSVSGWPFCVKVMNLCVILPTSWSVTLGTCVKKVTQYVCVLIFDNILLFYIRRVVHNRSFKTPPMVSMYIHFSTMRTLFARARKNGCTVSLFHRVPKATWRLSCSGLYFSSWHKVDIQTLAAQELLLFILHDVDRPMAIDNAIYSILTSPMIGESHHMVLFFPIGGSTFRDERGHSFRFVASCKVGLCFPPKITKIHVITETGSDSSGSSGCCCAVRYTRQVLSFHCTRHE